MLSFQFYFITEDHATPPVKVSWWNNTITYLRVQIADTFLSLYSTKLSTDWCVHGKRTYFTIYFSKKYLVQMFLVYCLLSLLIVSILYHLATLWFIFGPNKNIILRFTQFQDSSYIIYKIQQWLQQLKLKWCTTKSLANEQREISPYNVDTL